MIEFQEVKGERSRTYMFGDGEPLRIENVVRLCVRPSGTHRIETAAGQKIIVRCGWRAIFVDCDEWSF